VLFEAAINPVALQRRLILLGGELAHASGRRAVALYSHDVGENPARRALWAAQQLVQEGVCDRALVDLAAVHVQARRDGSRRYLSAAFGVEARYPAAGDPAGVLLTEAAAAVLPDVAGARLSERPWIQVEAAGAGRARSGAVTGETPGDPLVGHGALLAAMLASARAVVEGGPPTVMTVVGGLGTGKSRVCRAVRAQLAALHPGEALIALEARDASTGVECLADLLRRALDLPARAPPDGGRGLLGARLGAAVWPAVALSLGWLRPDAPEVGALGAAPGALRSAAVVAAGEALRARGANGRACLVLLDDAHLADEATLAALEYAALEEAGARVWVCAFARPALPALEQGRPGWGERAGRREAHVMGPLDAASAATLCRQLLLPVQDVPEAVVERLVERAQAMPLLLVELVRGLKREGAVRRDARDGSLRLLSDEVERLPDLPVLDWLAGREMDALPPALQAHARLCALLGDEVTPAEIGAVLRGLEREGGSVEEFPLDAVAGTQRLVAAGLLVRRAGQPERVAFRHPLLRESVARSAPEPLRRRVHLAAFALHRRPGTGREARLDRLAAHAAAAGLAEEAAAAYQALAERADARHAYLEAEIAYDQALAHARAPSRAALRGRGLARYRLGRYPDAIADLAAARALAAAEGDALAEIDLLLDEAMVLDWMGEYRGAEARVAKAEARRGRRGRRGGGETPEVPETPLLEARLLLGAGRSLHRADRQEEAAATLARAAALAAPLGDEGYETLVVALLLLGFLQTLLGRLEEAAAALDEAIRRGEERGDRQHLGAALNGRALLRASLGDRAGMLADFKRMVALGRELGQPALELVAHHNLAERLYLMDEIDAAEPSAQAAAAVAMRHAGGSRPAAVTLLLARIRLYRGDEAGAAALAAEVRARAEEARASGADAALSPAEDVVCSMIELATADTSGDDWAALETRSAGVLMAAEHLEVLEARALAALRRGRADEARRGLEAALAAAARVPNVMGPRLRRWLTAAGGEHG